MPSLYLIDGSSYLYRAFYAIKGLTNSKGFPTNATFGFTNMMLKIIKEKEPDFMAVVFDAPGPTKRQELFEAYKIQRPAMPEDLAKQLPHIKKVVHGFNITSFEVNGYEADDVLATLAKKAENKGQMVYIVTSDKDLNQVLSKSIKAYDSMKDKVTEIKDIKKRYGLEPEKIPEVMALMGDSIDNIPGVAGIGEKTALALLQKSGSLENLLNHPQQIQKPRFRKLIMENLENIKLSWRLAVIDEKVPFEFNLNELARKEPNWPLLFEVFRECEFNRLLKIIPSQRSFLREASVIVNHDALEAFMKPKPKGLTLDAIPLKVHATDERPLGLAIGISPNHHSYYLPIRHQTILKSLDPEKAIASLKKLLEDPEIKKTLHHTKFNMHLLKHLGINLKGADFDTMVASYVLNPNRQNHNLEDALVEHLAKKKQTMEEVLGQKNKDATGLPMEVWARYAGENVESIQTLREHLEPLLIKNGLKKLFNDIEMPLIEILFDMEAKGIKMSSPLLESISKEIEEELFEIKSRIYSIADISFNINSPKQLQDVLFKRLGLKPLKKTKSGYSTSMEVLQELASEHKLPSEILMHRSLSKLKNTYLDVLPDFVNPVTGRIHATFNQTSTATGRLSTSEPNLQNIPIRGKWAKRIREAFIPEEGFLFLSSDYSQIELRILAHLSGDESLVNAFLCKEDVHAGTAANLFDVPFHEVTSEMRRKAKIVNFGIIYGISPYGLSRQLGIPQKEAANFIQRFFTVRKGVQHYTESIKIEAKSTGYVTTLFGRKRDIPEINSHNKTIIQQGERLAVNTPIQGTASDIIKKAMISIWERIKKEKMRTRMLLQIHDELLFEVPENEIAIAEKMIRESMEGAANLRVPLFVDIRKGKNWAETHFH